MKTLKSFLMAFLVICAMISAALPVYAEETQDEFAEGAPSAEIAAATYRASGSWYDISWSVYGDTLTISGSGSMVDLNFYYNYPWYDYSGGVTKLVIGDNVTGIGNNAFSYMTSLTTISYGKRLSVIGTHAFRGCTSLKTLKIPSQVTTLGGAVFQDCTGLTSVSLPDTLEYIGYGLFMGCTGLKEVTINTSHISSNMFQDCTNLTTVTLGKNVSYTEYAAFQGCTSLSKVNLGTIEKIGSFTFDRCTGLESITLPSTLTTIDSGAFNYTGLKSIVIPDSVTTLGDGAFSNSLELTTATLGKGISTIPERCFNTSQKLTTVNLGSATEILEGAFSHCTSLKNITWPNKPFTIDYKAFRYCTSLTELNFPSTLRIIDGWAFDHCTGLQSITFQNGVEIIDDYAFNYGDDVISVTCFDPDVTFGEDVFEDYSDPVLRGWPGSTTESYASSNRLSFEPIVMTAPTPKKIVNTVSGVHVYWNPAEYAVTYSLYRSTTPDGTYTLIKSGIKATHYTDTSVTSGTTYYYKVVSCNGPNGSGKSAAQGIIYVGTPDITSRVNNAAGITLGWNKIQGATGYAIYRKSYDGNDAWERIATIEGNSTFSWTDTSVKNNNGTVYKYTIRALAGSNMKTLSGCRNAGRTMVRLSSQFLTSAAAVDSTSIKCTWTTSSRVTGYEVRFMVDGQVYKTYTIGNYKTGVKTFKSLEPGQTYTIQVRTYKKVDGVGSFYSDWSTVRTVTP